MTKAPSLKGYAPLRTYSCVVTNMVFVKLADNINIKNIATELIKSNILISIENPLRLVTHLDISKADIDVFIKKFVALVHQVKSA